MGVREALGRALLGEQLVSLQEEVRTQSATATYLQERLGALDLELDLASEGWQRYGETLSRDFSRDGLRKLVEHTRYMAAANPLINRAVTVQASYVWGLGVSIEAKHEDINQLLQDFLDDPGNRAEFARQQSRIENEIELQTAGNVFFVLVTDANTGRVQVRSIALEEISDIIRNPDDRADVWYYKRIWNQEVFDLANGTVRTEQRTAYYPDWRKDPRDLPDTIGDKPVEKFAPIYHVKVGGLKGGKFGIPEPYAALAWAKAVVEDLERFATIRAAQARFALQLKVPGGSSQVATAKARLGTTVASDAFVSSETNPPPLTGSTFIGSDSVNMSLVNSRTSSPLPDDARRLGLMVAAGVGLPEPILFGDPSTGNLATAKTLDRPTELRMRDRQTLWADVHDDLISYLIDWAIRAPNGPLRALGEELTDEQERRQIVMALDPATGQPYDRHVDVTFPDLLERDVEARVRAVVIGLTASGHPILSLWPPKLVARLILQALGLDDIDEELDGMFPDEGDGETSGTQSTEETAQQIVTEAVRILRARETVSTNGQH